MSLLSSFPACLHEVSFFLNALWTCTLYPLSRPMNVLNTFFVLFCFLNSSPTYNLAGRHLHFLTSQSSWSSAGVMRKEELVVWVLFVVVFFTHWHIFEGIYIFYLVIRNMLLWASIYELWVFQKETAVQISNHVRVRLGLGKARGKRKHGGLVDLGIIWNLGEGGKDSKEGIEEQKDSQVPWGQQRHWMLSTVNTLTLELKILWLLPMFLQ